MKVNKIVVGSEMLALNVNVSMWNLRRDIIIHYNSLNMDVINPLNHDFTKEYANTGPDAECPASQIVGGLTLGDYVDAEFFNLDGTQVEGIPDIKDFLEGNIYFQARYLPHLYGHGCAVCNKKLAVTGYNDRLLITHVDEEQQVAAGDAEPCSGRHPFEMIMDVPSGVLVISDVFVDSMYDEIHQVDWSTPYGRKKVFDHFAEKNIAFFMPAEECPDVMRMESGNIHICDDIAYTDEQYIRRYVYLPEVLGTNDWAEMNKKAKEHIDAFGMPEKVFGCVGGNTRNVCIGDYERTVEAYGNPDIEISIPVDPGKYKVTVYNVCNHPVDIPGERYTIQDKKLNAIIQKI